MSIDELCAMFGLSRHTIHKYVRDAVLPSPQGFGRWATYGNEHVKRLRAIREAKDQHVTLAELAERFAYQQVPAHAGSPSARPS